MTAEKDELTIVDDQYGSPTWSRTIAESSAQIIAIDRKLQSGQSLYHLSAACKTTWYGFTLAIIKQLRFTEKHIPVIKPITTAEYLTPALRPRNSTLDNRLTNAHYGLKLPDWQQQLELDLQS